MPGSDPFCMPTFAANAATSTWSICRSRRRTYSTSPPRSSCPGWTFRSRSTMASYASCRQPTRRADPHKRPFVVVDPRAGHGPGIGGFKPDSEVGAALKAGHPCYFVGFLPDPVPDQTVEDVMRAEEPSCAWSGELHPDGRDPRSSAIARRAGS